MPGRIPDRWEDYTPIGKPIDGTRFITFKVPLEQKMVASLDKDEQFTPEKLIETIKDLGHELGLVIDLTNTTRYYSNKELTGQNIKYSKVFTEGHIVPTSKVRKKFFSVIDEYLGDDANEDKLIGVHCTHGVNRTGYLVCRYMIDKLGFEPQNAIKAYGEARGYPIERENYLDDLKNTQKKSEEEEEMESEEEKKPMEMSGITVINRRNGRRNDEPRNNRSDSRNGPYQRQSSDNWNRAGWGQRNRDQNNRFSGRDNGNFSHGHERQGRNRPANDWQDSRNGSRRGQNRGQQHGGSWNSNRPNRRGSGQDFDNDRYQRGAQERYQGGNQGYQRYQGGQQQNYSREQYQGGQQNHSQDRYQGGQQNHTQDRYQGRKQNHSQDQYQGGQQQGYSQDRYQGGQRQSYSQDSYQGGQQQSYSQDSYQGGQQQSYPQNRYQGAQQQSYPQNSYQGGQQQSYSQNRYQGAQQQTYSQDSYQRRYNNNNGWNAQDQNRDAYQRAGWT